MVNRLRVIGNRFIARATGRECHTAVILNGQLHRARARFVSGEIATMMTNMASQAAA
jgi:hypothetical protein